MQRNAPAWYWAGWVLVLAAVTLMVTSTRERYVAAWGGWSYSGEHMVTSIILTVAAALIYAVIIWVALTKVQQVLKPIESLVQFLRDVYSELQRVVWPSHEDTYAFTVVVIVAMLVVAVWVGLIDAICINVMRGLYR